MTKVISLITPIRISIMTNTPGTIDVVNTYRIITSHGSIAVSLYDNFIPLNVHAIISEIEMLPPSDVILIIDKDAIVNHHLEKIVQAVNGSSDITINM